MVSRPAAGDCDAIETSGVVHISPNGDLFVDVHGEEYDGGHCSIRTETR